MNVAIDREMWLKAIADEGPLPSVPLAVPPHFYVTLRKHPEVEGDKLPEMAAVLIRYVQQLDRNLGGEGRIDFDPAGTIHTDAKLSLRLMVVPVGNFIDRINAIVSALDELAGQAKRDLVRRQDADINAKIADELNTIPREVAEHLEPASNRP